MAIFFKSDCLFFNTTDCKPLTRLLSISPFNLSYSLIKLLRCWFFNKSSRNFILEAIWLRFASESQLFFTLLPISNWLYILLNPSKYSVLFSTLLYSFLVSFDVCVCVRRVCVCTVCACCTALCVCLSARAWNVRVVFRHKHV